MATQPNNAFVQSQEELDTIARLQAAHQDFNLRTYGVAIPSDVNIMWNRIKAERDRRKESGGFHVGTKWYHSDTASRIQQLGLVMMGAGIPPNLQWKTMDGTFITMTQTLAGQIFATAAASDMAVFAAAETHRVAMEASNDPSAYDFSGGWPAVFGA